MNSRTTIVSTTDLARLRAIIDSARQDATFQDAIVPAELLDSLQAELDNAHVVEPWEVPADVVTMNSTVWFVDEATGEEECYTLVYPHQADVSRNRLSVLAPIGTALVGYRIGDVIEWPVPAGMSRLRVTKVWRQAEPVAVAEGYQNSGLSSGIGVA
jgi:regulator of nucleoside diphosphate kinase